MILTTTLSPRIKKMKLKHGDVCAANATLWIDPAKTASLLSLRVELEVSQAAESVLIDSESLSSPMESPLRATVGRRQMQMDFVARGLQSRNQARQTGE